MVQERANQFIDAVPVPEIEELLSRCGSASVVDRLLALPRPGDAAAPNAWERAVTSRLQSRISEMMRQHMQGTECKAA